MAEDPGRGDDGEPDANRSDERLPPQTAATVGTGSFLGVGCVLALLLLVLIAVALRVFTDVW